jgi:hypothetical protein
MKIETIQYNGVKIAEIISENILINEVQDGIDLLGELYYQNLNKVILQEKNINADFFDLRTGIAGEILQKFSNYRVQLAIVGDFSKYSSKSMRDFILESNKLGQINFVNSIEEAKEKLVRK